MSDVVQVYENLWIGAFDLSLLDTGNVVMCAVLRDPEMAQVRRVDVGGRACVALSNPGHDLSYYPFTDDIQPPSPTEEAVAKRAAELAVYHFKKKTVFVCCREGKNRSGLVAALAYRSISGCTGQEAIDKIRAARPGALYNPFFQKIILE